MSDTAASTVNRNEELLTMPRFKRCRAYLVITLRGGRWEELLPGTDVDLDRELAPGYTVGDAVAGREECFEEVPAAAPEPKASGRSKGAVVASTESEKESLP